MGKLSIQRLTASAEAAMGWPYVSPGTNDRSGIDCSGLFVMMYREQGAKIAHGSNTIFRQYCSETARLTSVGQLVPGMAVFKVSAWGDEVQRNRWYGQEPGDFHHIGYVASVSPLRIIHASSAAGCVTTDTKLDKWAYCGRLADVDYGTEPGPDPDPGPQPQETTKIVRAESGSTVNLRKAPDGALVDRVPIGETVTVYEDDGEWSRVKWRRKNGYMMSQFLVDEEHGDGITYYDVIIPHLAKHHAEALVANYTGAQMYEEGGTVG